MKHLIFLLPLLMDFSAGAFGALCVIYSQQQGASYFFLGPLLGTIPPLIYGLSCYLIGKWIRLDHIRPFLFASVLLCLAICAIQLVVPDYRLTVVTLTLFTATLAFFYIPYEILLTQQPMTGTLTQVAALYNVAWSIGFGAGSWLSGYLLDISRFTGFSLPIIGLILLMLSLYFHSNKIKRRLAASISHLDQPPPPNSDPNPNPPAVHTIRTIEFYIVIGWISLFTYGFISSYLRTVYVKTADNLLGLSPTQIGQLFGLHIFAITTASALCYFYPNISYRKTPALFALLFMGLAGAFFTVANSFVTVMISFILVGGYGAFAYVTSVTYGGSHPYKRARILSINQVMIGAGFLLGPLITGFFANLDYRAGMGIALAVIALQVGVLLWIVSANKPIELTPHSKP